MTEISYLYDLADRSNIDVDTLHSSRIPSFSIQLPKGKCCIAVNPELLNTVSKEKEALAHELGHCKTGAFYNEYTPAANREWEESRADRWMVTHLVPVKELITLLRQEYRVDEMAEYFEVSAQTVTRAYYLYKDLGLL